MTRIFVSKTGRTGKVIKVELFNMYDGGMYIKTLDLFWRTVLPSRMFALLRRLQVKRWVLHVYDGGSLFTGGGVHRHGNGAAHRTRSAAGHV